MDFINKDALELNKGLTLSSVFSFKQDPKLVKAIDKLYENENLLIGRKLPERKLDFSEVHSLLKGSSSDKGRVQILLSSFVYYIN